MVKLPSSLNEEVGKTLALPFNAERVDLLLERPHVRTAPSQKHSLIRALLVQIRGQLIAILRSRRAMRPRLPSCAI